MLLQVRTGSSNWCPTSWRGARGVWGRWAPATAPTWWCISAARASGASVWWAGACPSIRATRGSWPITGRTRRRCTATSPARSTSWPPPTPRRASDPGAWPRTPSRQWVCDWWRKGCHKILCPDHVWWVRGPVCPWLLQSRQLVRPRGGGVRGHGHGAPHHLPRGQRIVHWDQNIDIRRGTDEERFHVQCQT